MPRTRAALARLLAILVLLPAAPALAQLDAPPEPVLPPPPPPGAPPPPEDYTTRVRGVSPEWTQDRNFTSTRFWRLDPGSWSVETWLRTRVFAPDPMNGVRPPAELLFQQEVEVGINPHLQLDVYANFNINPDASGQRSFQYEGTQIEARISVGRYYGQYFGNPVFYLEWHPRRTDPDRAEFRLLMGGAPASWLFLAINPYVETNVESTAGKFIADMEFGTTVALGFRLTEWLRVSAEAKIGADMLGDANNQLHFVWWAGPGFILLPLRSPYFKIMGTCLFALPGTALAAGAQQFEPLLILGSTF